MSNIKSEEEQGKRRSFLAKLSFGLGGLAAAAASVPVIAAFLNPWIRKETRVWRAVGRADEFIPGGFTLVKYKDADPDPWAGSTSNSAAWLRRDSATEFTAFSVHCTHLGCPVRWVPSSELFMCPCHGGVYYKDGSVAAGPPPKSMVRYPVRVRNGRVEIETTAIPVTTSVRV